MCLAPLRGPSKAPFRPPEGSIDTHVHVFETGRAMTPDRGYTPPESNVGHLRDLHAALGIDRVVFTQPSIYATDNSAILDGMDTLNSESPNRARAVVAIGTQDGLSDHDLAQWHQRGVRGVRLNTDNAGGMPITWDELPDLCERIAPLGWHVEFLFPGAHITELRPVFESLPLPVVLAHFAYQPAAAGVHAEGFKTLVDLLRGGNTWLKISGADRVSAVGPPRYADVAPMAEALVAAAPERLMWGTDWPHPNKFEQVPDEGHLLGAFGDWVSDPALRQQILVHNPAAFYGF